MYDGVLMSFSDAMFVLEFLSVCFDTSNFDESMFRIEIEIGFVFWIFVEIKVSPLTCILFALEKSKWTCFFQRHTIFMQITVSSRRKNLTPYCIFFTFYFFIKSAEPIRGNFRLIFHCRFGVFSLRRRENTKMALSRWPPRKIGAKLYYFRTLSFYDWNGDLRNFYYLN